MLQSIAVLETINSAQNLSKFEFFTSHEALLLPYESALTRQVGDRHYNLSTHFPWVGMRTAQPDSGHIEYIQGIENPIAIKVGPRMTSKWLRTLLQTLDPHRQTGRLTLIHRFGVQQICEKLPPLIQVAIELGHKPLWICGPMHGNTQVTSNGIKTRRYLQEKS